MAKIFTNNFKFVELKNSKIAAQVKFLFYLFFAAIKKKFIAAFPDIFYVGNKSLQMFAFFM